MNSSILQAAQRRLEQGRRTQAMIDVLRGLLDGSITRAEAGAWTKAQTGRRLFGSGIANGMFISLCSIGERDEANGGYILREVELRAYLDILVRGEVFVADPDWLIGLEIPIEAFAERVGSPAVRSLLEGIGWFREVRFATFTGRPFVAVAQVGQDQGVGIHKGKHDSWQDAVVDLFEHFAIDERDAVALRPDVDVAQLPVWALWREDDNANKFEMERFHSYAKATQQEQIYRDRGHKQFYWVEPG